jgi:hypothetical protein
MHGSVWYGMALTLWRQQTTPHSCCSSQPSLFFTVGIKFRDAAGCSRATDRLAFRKVQQTVDTTFVCGLQARTSLMTQHLFESCQIPASSFEAGAIGLVHDTLLSG